MRNNSDDMIYNSAYMASKTIFNALLGGNGSNSRLSNDAEVLDRDIKRLYSANKYQSSLLEKNNLIQNKILNKMENIESDIAQSTGFLEDININIKKMADILQYQMAMSEKFDRPDFTYSGNSGYNNQQIADNRNRLPSPNSGRGGFGLLGGMAAGAGMGAGGSAIINGIKSLFSKPAIASMGENAGLATGGAKTSWGKNLASGLIPEAEVLAPSALGGATKGAATGLGLSTLKALPLLGDIAQGAIYGYNSGSVGEGIFAAGGSLAGRLGLGALGTLTAGPVGGIAGEIGGSIGGAEGGAQLWRNSFGKTATTQQNKDAVTGGAVDLGLAPGNRDKQAPYDSLLQKMSYEKTDTADTGATFKASSITFEADKLSFIVNSMSMQRGGSRNDGAQFSNVNQNGSGMVQEAAFRPESAASENNSIEGTSQQQIPGSIGQILQTIKKRESSNNYKAESNSSTASGAYQFIDSTWQNLAKKFNIGKEYKHAADAPPEIQDALAKAYVEDILKRNNGDISKIPLEWYTGNSQGKMSAKAIARNNGLTPEKYQSNWLKDFSSVAGSDMLNRSKQSAIDAATSIYGGISSMSNRITGMFGGMKSQSVPLGQTHETPSADNPRPAIKQLVDSLT